MSQFQNSNRQRASAGSRNILRPHPDSDGGYAPLKAFLGRHKSIGALLIVGLALGCHKQEPPPSSQLATPGDAPPPVSPRGPSRANENPGAPVVIAANNDANVILQQLTQALRDYVVRTRSVPKNFEEFAAKAHVQFPPAPDGKKYAIQDQKVVLVKR